MIITRKTIKMNQYEQLLEYNRLERELFEVDNTHNNFKRYFEFMNGKVEQIESISNSEIEKLNLEIRDLQERLRSIEIEKQTINTNYTELLERIGTRKKKQCANCGESGHNSRTCSK